ncbi:hypothetical protein, partial [Rhizobium leguminosarum]|uniref:hypothetical protein n=1 Tax=Rhizobium leguminosarum TaxID=384 RepID=UPI001C9292DF
PGFLVVRNSNEVSMEKLPFFIHENLDHRSGGEGQCGDRTPVTEERQEARKCSILMASSDGPAFIR